VELGLHLDGAGGLVDVRLDAEPLAHLHHPSVRVLPLVAEAQGHSPARTTLVVAELPEDVAGAQAAAHPEDERLGDRLSSGGVGDPAIGDGVGQGGHLGVESATEFVLRIGPGVEHVTARHHVRLAGAVHARANEGLELSLTGNDLSSARRNPRATHAHPIRSDASTLVRCCPPSMTLATFPRTSSGCMGTRSAGEARRLASMKANDRFVRWVSPACTSTTTSSSSRA